MDDADLKEAFVNIFNRLKEDKGEFIKTLRENIEKVLAGGKKDYNIEELEKQIEESKEKIHFLVQMKLQGQLTDDIYAEEYERMNGELENLKVQKSAHDQDIVRRNDYRKRVEEIIGVLQGKDGLLEQFDDEIFNALVEKIEILSPPHFVFVLKNGMRVEEFAE